MLGTGNAMCTRCYNTCFFLSASHGGLMVDAGGGNGIFKQLEKAKIPFEHIHHIFVTHCHTDHIMGIIWMIRKISPMMHRGKYHGTLNIYCHNEVKHALLTMCNLMLPQKIMRALNNGINLQEVCDGEQVDIDDMKVSFFDIGSTKTKQFGFSALLPSGKRVVCLGDEPFSIQCEDYVKGCDWLLAEAFCLYKDQAIFRPYEKHHSTALDAASLAQSLQVKNLILYHTEDSSLDTRKQTYTAEARSAFSGNIFVPDDLDVINI